VIDPDRFAALLCDWCVELREDDQVLIAITPQAMDVAAALHRAVLDRGAWPLIRFSAQVLGEDFYRHARERHLDSFAPLELAEAAGVDAVITVMEPANRAALAAIPTVGPHRARKQR